MGLLNILTGTAGVVKNEELRQKYGKLLLDDEEILVGFRVIRDTLIFTNFRLICIDVQGLMGKKTDYKTILYSSISKYSIETAGTFDLDADLKIWLRGESLPYISKKVDKKVDVYELQKALLEAILK